MRFLSCVGHLSQWWKTTVSKAQTALRVLTSKPYLSQSPHTLSSTAKTAPLSLIMFAVHGNKLCPHYKQFFIIFCF